MGYKFLGKINTPDDLKKLNHSQVSSLCDEIRDELINTVSKNGGHLASNLGVVELTVAIHRYFNSPTDSIIFDVGHQCYTHKLLTGRYEQFSTIRKEDGISGFMRPDESEYDPFVTGHASNSLAAAYGIYKAKALKGEPGTSVAVIGDGALTGGLAFEALNNIGYGNGNFIAIVNDNKMSISHNVGSMSEHFKKIRLKPSYYRLKYKLESILRKLPIIGKPLFVFLTKIKRGFARQVFKNNMFETFGFKYIGPVDGHNVKQLETAFEIASIQSKPCVIHAVTVKGKGYDYAEAHPLNYHGVSAFDTSYGLSESNSTGFSKVCGEKLCEMARKDNRVCAITAAMTSGTELTGFAEEFSDRFFDVGIAEEYAATFAAGLASGGMRPYFAVYSSFLQRAYDQIIHDTAIAGLPVCFLVDRAGIVGDDGETHQGVFDVSFLTSIPGITVYSPASYNELKGYIEKSCTINNPMVIRYPKGKEKASFEYTDCDFTRFSNNGNIAIVTYGIISNEALDAQKVLFEKDVNIDVIKLNKIYPLSDDLKSVLSMYDKIFFFEEGIRKGGISEHIVASFGLSNFEIVAIDNQFVPAASITAAWAKLGLDSDSMVKIIAGEQNG